MADFGSSVLIFSQFISINIYKLVCLFICLSVCQSVRTDDHKFTLNKQVEYICYFTIHIYKSICLSICLSVNLSVYQFVCLSICLSLSVRTDDQKYTCNKQVAYICYFTINIYKSICLSICLSVNLSVCQSVCLSICLSVC